MITLIVNDLYPRVRDNTIIYQFSDEEIEKDYGDGRILVDSTDYQAAYIKIDEEHFNFIGYVENSDIVCD